MTRNLHWVDGPEDEGEATDGSEEVADLATLGSSSWATVEDELPDDNQVGNACNGVPSPLLWSALSTESSEETSQDHDQVGDDGDEDAATVHASEKSEIKEQEWGGDGPVDVTGIVDLAVDVLGGVWDVLVRLADLNVVVANTVASSHGEVRERSGDRDDGGDNVIETLGLWSVSFVALNCRRKARNCLRLGRSMRGQRRRWTQRP